MLFVHSKKREKKKEDRKGEKSLKGNVLKEDKKRQKSNVKGKPLQVNVLNTQNPLQINVLNTEILNKVMH